MKYTSQHCCDKPMDDEMALYRECCSPNKTIMVNKVTFVFFLGGWSLQCLPMDPPLVLSYICIQSKEAINLECYCWRVIYRQTGESLLLYFALHWLGNLRRQVA